MVERWKVVHGWPLYEASTLGRVRRAVAGKGAQAGVILRVFWHKNGHGFVTLSQGTKASRVTLGVHKAVALAFHGPCPPGKETSHKNHQPQDNRPDNLEYLTHGENMAESAKLGRLNRGTLHAKAHCTEADVLAIRQLHAYQVRPSDIGHLFHIPVPTVFAIVHRRSWGYL